MADAIWADVSGVPVRQGTKKQTRLVLLCGLPASGKTTLARELADLYDAVRLNPDEWELALGIDASRCGTPLIRRRGNGNRDGVTSPIARGTIHTW